MLLQVYGNRKCMVMKKNKHNLLYRTSVVDDEDAEDDTITWYWFLTVVGNSYLSDHTPVLLKIIILQTMNYYNWLYNPFSWATIAILVMFYFMWWDMLLLVWYYCAKLPALSTNLDDVRLESSCSEFWFWTSFDIWFYVWIK